MEIIKSQIAADSRIHKDPEPMVVVGELADSSVNLIVRVWCARGSKIRPGRGTGSSRFRMWLSLGVRVIPNRLRALLQPFVTSRFRWKSKNDGLWVKNTENAPMPASAMEYVTLSPVRASANRSTVERKTSTRRLKVKGGNPARKGKLIDAGNSGALSQRLIQQER